LLINGPFAVTNGTEGDGFSIRRPYRIGVVPRFIEGPAGQSFSLDQPNIATVSVVAMYCKAPAVWGDRWTDVPTRLCNLLKHSPCTIEPRQLHALCTDAGPIDQCPIQRNTMRRPSLYGGDRLCNWYGLSCDLKRLQVEFLCHKSCLSYKQKVTRRCIHRA